MKNFILLLLCAFVWYCSSSASYRKKQDNPKTAFVFYYAAEHDIQQGNFPAALVKLDSAISYNPGYANFYQVKGWVFEVLEKPDSAIASYENCLKYRSNYPEVWARIGRLYLQTKKYENAAFYLKRAVQAYPDSASIHLILGEAYYKDKKYPLAMDYLRSYRKLVSSPEPQFWKWLGLTYYQTREYPKAVEPLTKYVNAVEDDALALKCLGIAKFNAGEHHDAITYLNLASELRKDDPEIYLYRARYFLVYGKPDLARQELSTALSVDSSNTDVLYELGVLDYKEEKYEKSKKHLAALIAKTPHYWPAYRYLGFLAEREENFLKAKEYYTLYLNNSTVEDTEVLQRVNNISSKTSGAAPDKK